ncbi:hypothetical protein JX265_011307 [Neoarthrinium moseri]|uniref:Autophagy protein n=1 Tax=Neoarthrinium moseri TaxID=1658444 RepID=A0A9P9WCR2_9PEZI|nr:hypothetical protein JX266_008998 [Neoarthrinium moseri]KAI1857106.1 hypothetical protein JX265_011307 [Neoarthrinium moseri]
MGWWQSLWGTENTDDPLRKLDPKLREYLEKESPVKYPSSQAPPSQPPQPQTKSAQTPSHTTPDPTQSAQDPPPVPKESEFQDGRYAHLWKTYRPLAEIEAETKSDQEKIMDVLEGYKERKSQIGRAALENCALEQVDWRSCMNNPSVAERLTMCRAQVKKFERCYTTQTRLLKALGYLSTLDRSPEVEEEIQMHADAMYQKLVAQEAEIEAAKAEGRPVPKFAPVVPKKPLVPSAAPDADLSAEQQATLKTRLENIPEEDHAAEIEAFRAEQRAKAELGQRLRGILDQQEAERKARIEAGQHTAWDRVMGVVRGNGEKK